MTVILRLAEHGPWTMDALMQLGLALKKGDCGIARGRYGGRCGPYQKETRLWKRRSLH